jgi:DNA gyrase inhibitor GyrI
MSSFEVKIVDLPAMRYVRFYGFGEGPEGIAIEKTLAWAAKNEYFENINGRWFGFNNPDPTPGSNNYGYEIWLTLPAEMQVEGIEVHSFAGGAYAVTNCSGEILQAGEFIPKAWKTLVEWVENSPYQMGKHQWLEEQLAENGLTQAQMVAQGKMSLDLYLPIKN